MEFAVKVVVLGRSIRNAANLKNRQPLACMYVKGELKLDEYFSEIIEDELNVKNVVFTDDMSHLSSFSFKPQLKTVGPKYGKLLGKIKAELSSVDGNAAMNTLEADGAIKFDFDGDEVVLTRDDLLIEVSQKPGYYSMADGGITAALDTTLTPELIEEGYVRELISKIQTMRKDSDFNVTDRIAVTVVGSAAISEIIDRNFSEISRATLANSIASDGSFEIAREWNINGENVTISVKVDN